MKDFEFLATVSVRGGSDNGKRWSISDGSRIWMGLDSLARVIAGVTGFGHRGGFWAAEQRVIEFSSEE